MTGLAVLALREGAELPPTSPSLRRGVDFLLRTQDADGVWFVGKRVFPGNNYFDTGFPFGHSQYISTVAASWAAMALLACEEAPSGAPAAASLK